MTLALELTPQEEAVLQQQASVQNIDMNALIRARLFGADQSAPPQPKHPQLAAILQSWIEEDATDESDEIEKSEEETEELLRNLQADRVDLGEGRR